MFSLPPCPDVDHCPPLPDDTLSPEERERYERHLDSCPACQDRLDRAADLDGTLQLLGRQFGDPTTVPADPNLSQFLEELHGVKSPLRTVPEPPDLYFLQPDDRPDVLGTLGAYEVQEVIGQGGMGVVLKAFDPALQRLVAIKVLAAALAGSATARRRFTREAQAAAAVCHDHVVAVHGVYEEDGLPYLVMQYVAGESLQERLDRTGPLELVDVVRIGLQTASGLAAAHAQGLIHRDIKPANLLLENGLARVKITDFGLARMTDDVGLTQHGVLAGTPEYMSPEQARGEVIDHRADLFSLGSVLYAMCTGRPPFRGATVMAVLLRVGNETPTPIRTLNPEVPAWLEALGNRLLAKDPADRFQSAAEVAALLEGYLAHLREPATAPAPALPPGRCREPSGTSAGTGAARLAAPTRLLGAAGLAAVVALAALGLWKWLPVAGQPGDRPAQPQPAAQKEFYQDFRGGKQLHHALKWTGSDGEEVVEPEDKGLRIKLTDKRKQTYPFGPVLPSAVKGNFEITTGYDIVQADQPRTGQGVGVELYLTTNTPTREALGFNRVKLTNGNEIYICIHMTTIAGKRRYFPKEFPVGAPAAAGGGAPVSKSGRLRVTRVGAEVAFWAVEGDGGEFRELCRHDFVPDDVNSTRVAAYPGQSSEPVDLRLVDLKVKADGLDPDLVQDAAPPPGGKPLAVSRGWLVAVELLGLAALVALVAVAVWLRLRRSHLAQEAGADQAVAPADSPEALQHKPDAPAREDVALAGASGLCGSQDPSRPAAAPFLSVRCSGCGKSLKGKATLAGKKVKCPQCGEMLLVPGIKAAESHPTI